MKKVLFIAIALAAAVSAGAQNSSIEFHGFGGSSFRKTSDNFYIGATPDGSYAQTELSLAVAASLTEKLRINTQGMLSENDLNHGEHLTLTYAFAEYSLTPDLSLRAGQIKLPFGNYGEIVHVGTLRPFLTAPQAVYGQVGVGVGPQDTLTGFGITGRRNLTPNVELAYDVYGGGMEMVEFFPPEGFLLGEPISNDAALEDEVTHNVLGGRLAFRLPQGLELGVSGYRGDEVVGDSEMKPRWVGSLHGQWNADRWLVRAEVAHETVQEDLKVDCGYVEAAYKLTEHWQVAAQFSDLKTEVWGVDHPIAASFLNHRESILGVNYWFSPNVVLKSSVHRINGNRFAGPRPEEYAELVDSGRLRPRTTLVMVGVDFSF